MKHTKNEEKTTAPPIVMGNRLISANAAAAAYFGRIHYEIAHYPFVLIPHVGPQSWKISCTVFHCCDNHPFGAASTLDRSYAQDSSVCRLLHYKLCLYCYYIARLAACTLPLLYHHDTAP